MEITREKTLTLFREVLAELSITEITTNREMIKRAELIEALLQKEIV